MLSPSKLTAVFLAANFCFMQTAFAFEPAHQKVSRQQIAKDISSSDSYRVLGIATVTGFAIGACALSVAVKKKLTNVITPPEHQIEKMYKDLVKEMSLPAPKNAAPLNNQDAAVYIAERKNAPFYKSKQILPSYKYESVPFWETFYTKHGGNIPHELDGLRAVVDDLRFVAAKTPKQQYTGRMNKMIMDINEKFYTLESLPVREEKHAEALLTSINADREALALITRKVKDKELNAALKRFISVSGTEVQLRDFRVTLEYFQNVMSIVYGKKLGQETSKMSLLAVKISTNISRAAHSKDAAEVRKLTSIIRADADKLAVLAARGEAASVETAAKTFLRQVTKELKGKGGAIGVGAVMLASVALIFVAQPTYAAQVSNSRLAVQRELSFAYQNTPDLFLAQVIKAKEQYGLNIVSSVMYEKQDAYYPLFKAQSDVMNNTYTKQYLKLVMGGNANPASNKAQLLNYFAK